MSNEKPSSLLSRLWAAAGCLFGCAVMVWVAMQLIQDVWIPLVITLSVAIILVIAVAIWRRRRW